MSRRAVARHDTDRRTPELADARYAHCSVCLSERPADIAPRDWARQQLSIGRDGRMQLWCTRHDINITTMSFVAEETH